MASYPIKLIERTKIAEGTVACYFEKPQNFTFKAGQFASFTLINPPETDAAGDMRFFSLASAPYEKELMIATRLRDSSFKRGLYHLPLGSELRLKGPYGDFILHEDPSIPAVYITGGIGITPVRSILHNAAKNQQQHKIFLFYANHRPEESAFLPELIALTRENPRFEFIATMTHMENSQQGWEGEKGYISEEMLAKYVGNLIAPIYYISGPRALITALRKILVESGVRDANIRTEEFSGY